jgi:NDP-sugar pyrophosphorylase family protein
MSSAITQAVILSAGFGTRLRPLTDNIPKVMLPLGGKPLLEHHIEQLKKHGIREFFINLHYLPEKITDYFGDGSKWGVKINYSYEPEILGTAGGVKNFDGKLRGDFFVIYGDVFSLIDYEKMIDAFYRRPKIAAMEVIGDNDHPYDSDLVEIDDDFRFLKIHPKPHKELPKKYKAMRAAAFIFNERIMRHIPAGTYYEIDRQLLPDLLSRGEKIYGYECEEFIKDIGTMERYREVEEYLEKKKAGA